MVTPPSPVSQLVERLRNQYGVSITSVIAIETAFRHRSYVKQHPEVGDDFERLEFLGDAVLKLVISKYLYDRFPDSQEGDLTQRRAKIISDAACFQYSKLLDLGQYLWLSASEEKSGGRERASTLGNAFEALLGAIYLDGGLANAEQLCNEIIKQNPLVLDDTDFDYKTRLQELLQKQHLPLPEYTLVETVGPDHDKRFRMRVTIYTQKGESIVEIGEGPTKKIAEQAAAKGCFMKQASMPINLKLT